jgi:hypothetical protein
MAAGRAGLVWFLASILTVGCRNNPAGTDHSSPVTAPPAAVVSPPAAAAGTGSGTDRRSEAAQAPAVALRAFWRDRDARRWRQAHERLSADSRSALTEKSLAESARLSAPTPRSGPAWAALFSRAVSQQRPTLVTQLRDDSAEVQVRLDRSAATVRMVREAGDWKIDLLQTLSSPQK